MFEKLYSSYRNIISNIAIIGYSENDIINRGNNLDKKLELTCLFSYPELDETSYNSLTYDMMFPDGNHKIECPKFFSLYLTDSMGNHSYLYCLKLPEKFQLDIVDDNDKNKIIEINVPLVICIKSDKSDLEPFRQLLTSINQIMVCENSEFDSKALNNYKKVELMNILYFIFSLPHTSPHSLVRLKLNNDLCDVEDEIDFYYSSNCEIPCNKNDTDINLLFCFLEQSIIIKVIIALLFEKPLIFRASQAYILHLIIPTFLKLLFPFKWLNTCINVLSKEDIDLLDAPGSYIIGVLSSTIQVQEIMDNYPGKIIVDCDTNEIFGEYNLDPFIAPKGVIVEDIKKSKKSKKNKEEYSNMNGGITQGKNIFFVDKNRIYQYDPEKNGKGKKLKFNEKNNIIIDTQNSQFLINKSYDYINSDEYKWLRKNIQLVRNPEIFEIENIKKNKSSNNKNLNDDDSPILPNRSFSYNIQNIFIHFYLNKISDLNSDFMGYFKDINLYLNFLEDKKYQNNSSKRIIENIKETINEQRSIDNCFVVEYNLKPFCAVSIIDNLDKKIISIKSEMYGNFNNIINNNTNNIINDERNKKIKYNIYIQLKNILMDYCLILGINSEKAKNETFNIEDNKLQNISINSSKSRIKLFKNNHHKGHIKSNSSLQFTYNQNPNFNFAGIDRTSKNFFKFYGKDGFLSFLKDLEEFIKEEGKEFDNIIYKMKIYHQLINIYKNLDNIFKNPNEENSEAINVDIDVIDKDFTEGEENDRTTLNIINNISNNNNENNYINNNNYIDTPPNDENNMINNQNNNILEELRSFNSIRKTKNNSLGMFMIAEKDEENNESYIERTTQKKYSEKSNNEDLGNIILNNFNFKMDENIDDNINKEEIIVFPDFENKKEKDDKDFMNQFQFDNNNIDNNNNKNNYNVAQYYLFLAYYLEEINADNALLEKFNKDIYNSLGTQININKYIIKLYKESYNRAGEKFRDFSFFNFYTYLKNLDNETFLKVGSSISEDNNNKELCEIYNEVKKEKKIIDYKNPLINDDIDNNNSIEPDRAISISETENNKNTICDIYSPNYSFRPESYNPNYIPSNGLSNKGILIPNYPSSFSHSYLQENNCSKVNVINSKPLFKSKINPKSSNILNEFCSVLMNCFPSKEDIQTKNNHQILNEVHNKSNIQSIRELLGELSNFKLSLLANDKEKICFWLNCFNFLSLYAIFYLKLNITEKEIWNNFFSNIKFNIGGFNFSLEDMNYILFQKNVFIPNKEYLPRDYVKKSVIDLSKLKNILNKVNPYLLFLPNKEFFSPVIYDEHTLENDIEKRCVNYFLCNLNLDENNETLTLNELMLIFEPDFLGKGLKKYKDFIDNNLYKKIKNKKYSKKVIRPMKWQMSFDYLLEDVVYIES